MNRPDDPDTVMKHKNAYECGVALIILGGPSGAKWQEVAKEINPDVILGANATCTVIDNLDYWMLAENMTRSSNLSKMGDERSIAFMRMLTHKHHARFRLISHRSWHLLKDTDNCIKIRRRGYELDEIQNTFSLREYGEGYLHGAMLDKPGVLQRGVKFRVGTVGLQLLHHAGILGVREVHTIGYDLCFKGQSHHWYPGHPRYEPDRFRTNKMFTEYEGVPTQWDWIQGALYLKAIYYLFERDNLEWVDHSDGLLKVVGVPCAR